jgi:hypothetical protein
MIRELVKPKIKIRMDILCEGNSGVMNGMKI